MFRLPKKKIDQTSHPYNRVNETFDRNLIAFPFVSLNIVWYVKRAFEWIDKVRIWGIFNIHLFEQVSKQLQ